jgi:hypothetical protein
MFSCGDLMLSIVTDPDILLCNSKKYPRDTTMWFLIIIILWWLWCIICIYIYVIRYIILSLYCTMLIHVVSYYQITIRLLSDYYQITIRLLSDYYRHRVIWSLSIHATSVARPFPLQPSPPPARWFLSWSLVYQDPWLRNLWNQSVSSRVIVDQFGSVWIMKIMPRPSPLSKIAGCPKSDHFFSCV